MTARVQMFCYFYKRKGQVICDRRYINSSHLKENFKNKCDGIDFLKQISDNSLKIVFLTLNIVECWIN